MSITAHDKFADKVLGIFALVFFMLPWPRVYFAYNLRLEMRPGHLPFLVPQSPDTPSAGIGEVVKKFCTCRCRDRRIREFVHGIGSGASTPSKQEMTLLGSIPNTVVQTWYQLPLSGP